MSAKQKQAEANIQTFLRIRPSKNPSGYFTQDDIEKGSLLVDLPSNYKSGEVNNSKLKYSFHFNGIIDANATQDEVFKRVGVAAVQNAIEGFNSTIFAYGQTGSGKTFTLTGSPERYQDRGIIPRAISMLYNEYRSRTDIQFKAYISYLELYNEQGYDLLDPSHETKSLEDLPKVVILEDEHQNFHLKNLSMHPADTEEDALNLLFLGDTNRAIAETPMNLASSRSHCIFTISLECRVVGTDKVRRSKLHLVDLAGSERVAKTNSSGSVLTEAKYINSSLFFLEMVIVALYEKATKGREHIPYRNSMMTSVLRDSLGGNCKTIMIATINPEAAHTEESLSTCKFAQRVSLIKNKALLNEETDPSIIIRRLKEEMLSLREEVAFLKGESGEGEVLSPKELDELKTKCRQYCYDLDPQSTLNIGALTLTKIKDVFAIMKNLVLEASNNGSGGRGGGGGGGDDSRSVTSQGGGGEETEKLARQVKDLKSLLLQRDSEIQILVNMVQKGKTVEDVASAQARVSRGGPVSEDGSDAGHFSRGHRAGGEAAAAGSHTVVGLQKGGRSFQEQQQLAQMQREKEHNERIIQRHLFGVPPPTDKAIFEDAAASFQWFRERCSLNASLEENKAVLKEKMEEAKTMGARGKSSQNAINYLKKCIEDVRRERVLHRLNAGAKDDADSTGAEEAESEDETIHRRAIEQEKAVYRECVDRLKVLKPEIEHIGKVIEKCRATMQTQFDQWFQNLHARSSMVGNHNAHGSAYADVSSSMGSTAPGAFSELGSTFGGSSVNNSMSTIAAGGAGGRSHYNNEAEAKGSAGTGSDRKAPGGVGMTAQQFAASMHTADSKMSDEVNEDIEAFYQAKNELLRRKGANARP